MEADYLLVQDLVAQGQDIKPWDYLLGNAASHGREDICQFLLSNGVDGHEHFAWLPHYDQLPNQMDLLRLFCHYGVRVSRENPDDGETSMHHAALLGNLTVLRFLVEEAEGKSAFNVLNDLDWTPLHCAVHDGHLDCARYLLDQGADPNAIAYRLTPKRIGDTVLLEAAGNDSMIALLLEWGADPDFPGWMWRSFRSKAGSHPLLAIPRLDSPEASPHRAEIEQQLLESAPHGSSIDWQGCQPHGPVVQLRGQPLQAADRVQLVNPVGKIVWRGRFRFLILTGEQRLRAFFVDREGVIPQSIWQELCASQRFFVCSDVRNQDFRRDAETRPY